MMLDEDHVRIFFRVAQGLTYINAVINPLLYNILNSQYRKSFKEAFSCCWVRFKTDDESTATRSTVAIESLEHE